MTKVLQYDAVVVGGGHAGCEAAAAAARLGKKIALVTFSENNIGQMSCNPSIGGVGKGIIVKEVDALDGVMPKAIDKAAIHYKTLNSSKGPAVWGPRAQADRDLYKTAVLEIIKSYKNIDVIEAEVTDLDVKNNVVIGVKTSIGTIETPSVVITTGTFLGGRVCIGDQQTSGGRIDEKPSNKLAEFIRGSGFKVARMKTGTPARIKKDTINYDIIEKQEGDKVPQPFSLINNEITLPQICCYMTYTNEESHEIVRRNLQKTSLHAANVDSVGPRYCPSIDDKVVRFAHKDKHQVFLEPEGLENDLVYPMGLSTSLPVDIQKQFYRAIKGLENAEFGKMGYVIEYDFVDPRELYPTLETKKIKGLFLAGQINGTTGYEEAAGQGLIAGINAVFTHAGKEFITPRSESYIGVMISDLTNQGVTEPYRMMTSRSEYRVYLRPDNAYARLTPKGIEAGVITKQFEDAFLGMSWRVTELRKKLQSITFTPNQLDNYDIKLAKDGKIRSVYELMSIPIISDGDIAKLLDSDIDIYSREYIQLKAESLYKTLEVKMMADIEKFKESHDVIMPSNIDYFSIDSLAYEARQRLTDASPRTLADAKVVQGITPSAIAALQVHLRKVSNV